MRTKAATDKPWCFLRHVLCIHSNHVILSTLCRLHSHPPRLNHHLQDKVYFFMNPVRFWGNFCINPPFNRGQILRKKHAKFLALVSFLHIYKKSSFRECFEKFWSRMLIVLYLIPLPIHLHYSLIQKTCVV